MSEPCLVVVSFTQQAGDRAFKEELGKLVDLSIWEEARAVANKEVADRCACWGGEEGRAKVVQLMIVYT